MAQETVPALGRQIVGLLPVILDAIQHVEFVTLKVLVCLVRQFQAHALDLLGHVFHVKPELVDKHIGPVFPLKQIDAPVNVIRHFAQA